jgi:hypothetical protein
MRGSQKHMYILIFNWYPLHQVGLNWNIIPPWCCDLCRQQPLSCFRKSCVLVPYKPLKTWLLVTIKCIVSNHQRNQNVPWLHSTIRFVYTEIILALQSLSTISLCQGKTERIQLKLSKLTMNFNKYIRKLLGLVISHWKLMLAQIIYCPEPISNHFLQVNLLRRHQGETKQVHEAFRREPITCPTLAWCKVLIPMSV